MHRSLLLLGALGALLLGLAGPAQARQLKAPIATSFEIAGSPQLNATLSAGVIKLVWRGTPDFTPDNATLYFSVLAPGGDRYNIPVVEERALSIAAGQTVEQTFEFQPAGPGQWIVIATIGMDSGENRFGEAQKVVVDVSPDGKTTVGRERAQSAGDLSGEPSFRVKAGSLAPTKNAGRPKALADTLYKSHHPSLADAGPKPQVTGGGGAFTIKGYAKFTDRVFTDGAFTGTTARPLRQINIDFLEDEGGNNPVLIGTAFTNNSGYYSFVVPDNNDGPGEGGRDIRIVAYALLSGGGSVADASDNIHLYRLGTKFNWGGGTLDAGTVTIPLGSSAAFNIADNIQKGHDYVKAKGESFVACWATWFVGNDDGSHYTDSESTMYIAGAADNLDEWDDSVILHEYGHFASDKYSFDKNPGGTHGWTSVVSGKLAWAEGWASFFASAVRNSKFYVENETGTFFRVNLEVPNYGSDGAAFDFDKLGDGNEGMVAFSLYDIWDSTNDGPDTLSAGSANIWTIFTNDFSAAKNCVLLDFYNGWKSRAYADRGKVDQIFEKFGITYSSNREVWFPDEVGYVVIRGKQLQMQWARFGSATVTAKLLRNNLTVKTIGDYQDTSGDLAPTFYWNVSNDVVAGTNYVLRAVDKVNPTLFATASSTFRIINPPIVITVGAASVTRNISVPGEEDWYRFTAEANTTYIIETLLVNGGLTDSYISVNGSDCASFFCNVATDDDSGAGAMSKITKFFEFPGTFYIMVEAFDGVSTGQYGIRVRKQ